VLDGVWVVRTSYVKNLLEVVFGRLGVPLGIVFSHRHELLVGVLDFFAGIAIIGHCSEMMWTVLLLVLSALIALFGVSDSGTGGHGPATASGCTCTDQHESSPDSLLA
jgi:hypothetical protein